MLHCKFSGDYNSERIFKIGQYLTKLCVQHLGFTFFWPTLYIARNLLWVTKQGSLLWVSSSRKICEFCSGASMHQPGVKLAIIRSQVRHRTFCDF